MGIYVPYVENALLYVRLYVIFCNIEKISTEHLLILK